VLLIYVFMVALHMTLKMRYQSQKLVWCLQTY